MSGGDWPSRQPRPHSRTVARTPPRPQRQRWRRCPVQRVEDSLLTPTMDHADLPAGLGVEEAVVLPRRSPPPNRSQPAPCATGPAVEDPAPSWNALTVGAYSATDDMAGHPPPSLDMCLSRPDANWRQSVGSRWPSPAGRAPTCSSGTHVPPCAPPGSSSAQAVVLVGADTSARTCCPALVGAPGVTVPVAPPGERRSAEQDTRWQQPVRDRGGPVRDGALG